MNYRDTGVSKNVTQNLFSTFLVFNLHIGSWLLFVLLSTLSLLETISKDEKGKNVTIKKKSKEIEAKQD